MSESHSPEPSDDPPPQSQNGAGVITRRRVGIVACVAAFLIAFFAIGAVSRSTPQSAPVAAAPAGTAGPGTVPFASWYWTMAASASNPNVLVLGTSNGLYRSSDDGKSWLPTGPKGLNATSVADLGKAMLAGGVAGAGPSPVERKGAGRVVSDGAGWLAQSTDDGHTWTQLRPRGLPTTAVQAVAVDPNGKSVDVLLNTGALYQSIDGAHSFRLATSTIGIVPWALAITPKQQYVGGDMDIGSHVSPNGRDWLLTPYTDARGGHMVMEYAVQPTSSPRILMTSIGIKISSDNGKSWRPSLSSQVMFGPVAWEPGASNVAYAVGFDGSVWRTGDAAKSWTKLT
jgi:photosystem II stability/assembly factor-like uncharacterized protein